MYEVTRKESVQATPLWGLVAQSKARPTDVLELTEAFQP
jgi:hypothetical protein